MAEQAHPKEAIRKQLEFGRADQLREHATRRFIVALERPTRFSSSRPVTHLIADGRRLARQLEPIAALTRAERVAHLAGICRPYLQLVDADGRDEHSGIRLMDIWRYFRHTWATRYRSSPGRNLFYLVRDAGQPNHPVMAITALGNAVMQLTCRDDALGWTRSGLEALIRRGEATDQEVLEALRARLLEDLSDIYIEDLPVPRPLGDRISDEVLDRLLRIEEQAAGARVHRLKEADDDDAAVQRVTDITTADLVALARTDLFRAKRARAARELLRALRALRAASSLAAVTASDEGSWALSAAIRQLKKRFSATAMMEITVCGAIAPYNHLLGGKLACLMMTSPQVRRGYADRYDDGYSIIASQMAGRLIVKEPCLVFLGTTSLYTERSSQYNRVRLPVGAVAGQTDDVPYQYLGESRGYGSPNLSQETEEALEQLRHAVTNYRNVNFVFGEGQSPKLRQLREGFAALGLERTDVLNHGSQRIVYGIPLARNTTRYLLGIDREAEFSVPETATATDEVAAFWLGRWLASRLDHPPALAAVGASTPLTERVSRLIPEESPEVQMPLFAPRKEPEERRMSTIVEDEKITFIRQLYRDESAYSDHVKLSRLRELNVKTGLDNVVRRIVQAGGSVVITGNAGDGKTHTIRLLEADLQKAGAKVIADASEHPHEHVVSEWAEARAKDQPFCIAINEGLLVTLIRTYRAQHPWLDAVRDQLLSLYRYVPVEAEDEDEGRYKPEKGATVVIDLSLRRTLAPELIHAIILKLTDDAWYGGCASCPAAGTCPVKYNRTMLRNPSVRERLVQLLNRVGERGVRATFREVLSFGSFLIFGGRTCAELAQDGASEQARYYWNAFEGQGTIFEQLELGLDPVRQTDARTDERLWRGKVELGEFSGSALLPPSIRNLDEVQEVEGQRAADAFAALKRRWYFEHQDGRLGHATQADRLFYELQDPKSATQARIGRLISLINAWWNEPDRAQPDRLRLWTRLSYSPRAHGKAMVSGRDVSSLRLSLFRPKLAPALHAAFGRQPADHILLAPPDNVRFASLLVDRRLLASLISSGVTEQAEEMERRLVAFNDALARHAEVNSHVRTIELLDPESGLNVKVRVDLSQKRYDSAQ
ncbi:Druantia anti-phage system protein DruA [Sorangium sp. So ce726]|uniref:Druantia anti-phage system protein DruA n=1 Tax=Sorangium sp. So ce726 TaxID=3133319 RepID=UPI003F606FFF